MEALENFEQKSDMIHLMLYKAHLGPPCKISQEGRDGMVNT
jgi:hypothetical protein